MVPSLNVDHPLDRLERPQFLWTFGITAAFAVISTRKYRRAVTN